MRGKTGFDRFLSEKLGDAAFRREFDLARAEIDATDGLIRALESARAVRGVSKAELARRISSKPEMVRRLLTDQRGNPTIATVLKVAAALGYHLELVPDERAGDERDRRAAPIASAARDLRAPSAARTGARASGTRPRVAGRHRSRAR